MIVNVDPHATSYDETKQVMKFAAVASGVMTIRNNVPVPVLAPATRVARGAVVVRASLAPGEEEEEVEYEEGEEEGEEGEEGDEFVEGLLEELSAVRSAVSVGGRGSGWSDGALTASGICFCSCTTRRNRRSSPSPRPSARSRPSMRSA